MGGRFSGDAASGAQTGRATPWLMRAQLVVSDAREDLGELTRLAGLEPTAFLRPGDVVRERPLRVHQWRLESGADARGAILDDHVDALADLIGDHINTLAAALRELDPASVELEVVLQTMDEAPPVRLSVDGVDILAQLRASLRVETVIEPDYGFLDDDES